MRMRRISTNTLVLLCKVISAYFVLLIGIEENFQFIPRNQTFYRGLRFIRISCRPPVSDPAPKITWLWNDRKVNPHSVPNFATSNYLDPRGVLYNALEIRNPGTVLAGNYSCVASNVGGERISDFTVTEIRKFFVSIVFPLFCRFVI